MSLRKIGFFILSFVLVFSSCKKDDDGDVDFVTVEIRDRGEQQAIEDIVIENYLKTHFFTLVDNDANPDYQIVQFDTIAGNNSTEPSIWDSEFRETKIITSEDVDYTVHILNFNSGVETERSPTFADSTLVTYRGEIFYDNKDKDGDGIPDEADVDADGDEVIRTDKDDDGIADDSDADDDGILGTDDGKTDSDGDGIIDSKDPIDNNDPNRRVFDSAVTPIWFDQLRVVKGLSETLVDFKGASGLLDNSDGTVSYNMDFGNCTVFFPSGLGYYSSAQTDIPEYSPLIFSIQLYRVIQSDHDNDGVPSYLEDLDSDRIVFDEDDDTDGDGTPNYLDIDDDGDGVLTINEDINNDGDPTNDIGANGIPNYLDPEESTSKE